MLAEEAQAQEQQRKRSKRHRRNRNNISDKSRVESVKEFAVYSREVERQYRSRLTKREGIFIYK